MGMARVSLEELLLGFQDFLRQNRLLEWGKDHPQVQIIRRLAFEKNTSYKTYRTHIESPPPEKAANAMLCLVHQTNFLLGRQLRHLGKRFLAQGGFTEKLYHTRLKARGWP